MQAFPAPLGTRSFLASNAPKRMTPMLRPRTTLAGSNQVAGPAFAHGQVTSTDT